jgi:hypothetical protein
MKLGRKFYVGEEGGGNFCMCDLSSDGFESMDRRRVAEMDALLMSICTSGSLSHILQE